MSKLMGFYVLKDYIHKTKTNNLEKLTGWQFAFLTKDAILLTNVENVTSLVSYGLLSKGHFRLDKLLVGLKKSLTVLKRLG